MSSVRAASTVTHFSPGTALATALNDISMGFLRHGSGGPRRQVMWMRLQAGGIPARAAHIVRDGL